VITWNKTSQIFKTPVFWNVAAENLKSHHIRFDVTEMKMSMAVFWLATPFAFAVTHCLHLQA
jgi:Holliday junction resolvase-like predicted endonuclease